MQCEIARMLFETLTAITAEQKVPRTYLDGLVLYHAELDLLEKIDENPGTNVSMLSEKSGVTKSAITQMSAKLLEKGLIERYQDPKNKKEKFFRLTAEGQAVRQDHAELHKATADELRDYLCSLQVSEKKIILEFLEKIKKCMPVCAFSCQCGSNGTSCFLAMERKELN